MVKEKEQKVHKKETKRTWKETRCEADVRDHTPVLIPPNKLAKDSLAKNAVAEVGEGFLRVGLRGTAEVGVLGGC